LRKEGSQLSHDKDRSSGLAGSNQEGKQKDIVLDVLGCLPDKWDRSKNAMELLIIADSQDAGWVARRIFQDIDRGLIKANFISTDWLRYNSSDNIDIYSCLSSYDICHNCASNWGSFVRSWN